MNRESEHLQISKVLLDKKKDITFQLMIFQTKYQRFIVDLISTDFLRKFSTKSDEIIIPLQIILRFSFFSSSRLNFRIDIRWAHFKICTCVK